MVKKDIVKLGDIRREAIRSLKEMGKDSANIEVDIYLSYLLKCRKIDLLMGEEREITEIEMSKIEEYLIERGKSRPLQYIMGECEFMGLKFHVGEGVLIPRSDTEVLIEKVLEIHSKDGFKKGVDICTGSGCIAISLDSLGKDIVMMGIDISEDALVYAKKNNELHGEKVRLVQGDLFDIDFEDMIKREMGEIDFIVSNPPYIESEETEVLMEEVRVHEPMLALDGGGDGLMFYRKITDISSSILNKNGWLFFEIGYNQGEAVSEIMRVAGFDVFDVVADYGGNDRVVYGKFRG